MANHKNHRTSHCAARYGDRLMGRNGRRCSIVWQNGQGLGDSGCKAICGVLWRNGVTASGLRDGRVAFLCGGLCGEAEGCVVTRVVMSPSETVGQLALW